MTPGPAAAHGYGRARSWLYVPGHRADLVAKAVAGEAEAVVVDLEDAVPPASKAAARDAVAGIAARPRTRPLWVRMNTPAGPEGRDDAEALAGLDLDGVRVPKAVDPDAVADLAARVGHPLHLLVESALGVERAYALAGAHPSVVGLSLGEADLAADLQVADPAALDWARQRVVVACRAAGLAGPLAAVWTDLPDLTGLAADSRRARERGHWGRSVIHPRQIPVVHDAFTVSGEEVARARALLASVEAAAARGASALRDADGRFVDPAVVAGARVVLDRAGETPPEPDPVPPSLTAAHPREDP